MDFHETTVLGNLGKDPELRVTQGGKKVTKFSVAVNEKYGENESVTWYNVVTWEKLAEFCQQYLSKGSKVFVKGRMSFSTFTDREGRERQWHELVANKVIFLDKKSNGSSGSIDEEPGAGSYEYPSDEDIPF